MRNIWQSIATLLSQIYNVCVMPLRRYGATFVFLYILGVASAWLTLPHYKGAEPYAFLYKELFVDLWLVCWLLGALAGEKARWRRVVAQLLMGLFVVASYGAALADVYCYDNYGSTLTPSMLMLVGETNAAEASSFLSAMLSAKVLAGGVGWLLALAVAHMVWAWSGIAKVALSQAKRAPFAARKLPFCKPIVALLWCVLFVDSLCSVVHNKVNMANLFSAKTIAMMEKHLAEEERAKDITGKTTLYAPLYRLAFSIHANQLASHQVDQLLRAAKGVKVDSCSFASPNIVLIIGESYGKHHAQLYGYPFATTPRQVARQKEGRLTAFSDVVTCWNLTSFVFKNMFSLHVVGQEGDWADYGLFPEVFRKAGYHVTFLTNQFLPQAKQAVYDFSGGFFLNNPALSALQFDTRNSQLHRDDRGLLSDFDRLHREGKAPVAGDGSSTAKGTLTIFHLMGQHVNYAQRYRHSQSHFWASTYEEARPELSDKQRKVLSYYDNATLYNDSIVDEVIKRFDKQDAIVIYVPDHGEECYEPGRNFICRQHTADIDWPLAHYEFEIPFWLYVTPTYAARHPETVAAIRQAQHRPFMTDALSHLLLGLAGIATPQYQAQYDLLSPRFDASRPRILKAKTDYNELLKAHKAQSSSR